MNSRLYRSSLIINPMVFLFRQSSFCIVALFVLSLHAEALFTFGTISDDSTDERTKNRLIERVRSKEVSTEEKIDALDSLNDFSDPLLFDTFKDAAFRNEDKELNSAAVDRMTAFATTYRLSELFDTLTDLIAHYHDQEIRIAALQSASIMVLAFESGIPFDRRNFVEALIKSVAPQSYIKEARYFYSAVKMMTDVGCVDDDDVIAMLEYLRDHSNEYQLENGVFATDEKKLFDQRINKTYFEAVRGKRAPALIDELSIDLTTSNSISVIAFMLDSAFTDSLGFLAIDWLLANGQNENGDEGKRLEYLYRMAYRKRPETAGEIMDALRPLLYKYGIGVNNKSAVRNHQPPRVFAWYNRSADVVTVQGTAPGDVIAMYDLLGKCLFCSRSGAGCFRLNRTNQSALAHYVLTINNRTIDCIRR